jgi:hypothetical protein
MKKLKFDEKALQVLSKAFSSRKSLKFLEETTMSTRNLSLKKRLYKF